MSGQAADATSRVGGAADLIRNDLAELLRLAWPVVFARVGIMTMGLTDALVVGQYSAVQLGYHALGWAPTAVVLTVGLGLISGVQVMASRALGEGRLHEAGAVLRRGLSYSLWIGLASTAILVAGGPLFLRHAGLAPDLAQGASRALVVFSMSLPATALSVAGSSWLEGLGRPKPAMAMMWIANVVNLLADLLLVPGTFGLPAMGAVGGAWATTASRTALAVVTLIYIARMKDASALGVFDKPVRDHPREIAQRRIGYGAGASNLFEVAAFASMNVIAGWLGAIAVAAYAAVINVASLVFMVPLGLSTATAVLVGRAYGAGDRAGVTRAALVGFSVAAVFGIAVSLLVWPGAELIARAFTRDPAAMALAATALALSALFLAPDAVQVVVAQALRTRGDVLAPTLTHMTSYAVVMIPLAAYLAVPAGMGIPGILWAIILATFLSAALLLGRFWFLSRRR
ncbi:MAG TPA: MATE family efflux transporter [Caulobacteraceae bacterium]|nr:MATE family efflux transporter [Caulobacteraceae bacterium]